VRVGAALCDGHGCRVHDELSKSPDAPTLLHLLEVLGRAVLSDV
jgi:hypothetical protein